ncbi:MULTISPECIES: PilW family protein [unclassified Thioalkalivibrio]|uniref:PilW family protein n=1 Tax=unclassified Thioalkalivibrio TaxID=2621013 RepID=UPI002101A5A7|nr:MULTISPECIES: prepilin-type N-terminal cleavage/methylation domain-containing protein [unclassified Thioalkalivibrio]
MRKETTKYTAVTNPGKGVPGRRTAQHGVTLIELMIGLVVGLIVLLALSTVYIVTVSASNETLSSVRLNQDMRSTMLIVSSDIRRAGYWNQNLNAASPFAQGTGQGLQLDDCASESTNCGRLDYAFDRNRDGTIGSNELYGFRLSEGSVQMLNPSSAPDDEEWVVLVGGANDPVEITSLTFTAIADPGQEGQFLCRNISTGEGSFSSCSADASDAGDPGQTILQKRRIRIVMEGRLGDHRVTLTETVRVRNDRRVTLQ